MSSVRRNRTRVLSTTINNYYHTNRFRDQLIRQSFCRRIIVTSLSFPRRSRHAADVHPPASRSRSPCTPPRPSAGPRGGLDPIQPRTRVARAPSPPSCHRRSNGHLSTNRHRRRLGSNGHLSSRRHLSTNRHRRHLGSNGHLSSRRRRLGSNRHRRTTTPWFNVWAASSLENTSGG